MPPRRKAKDTSSKSSARTSSENVSRATDFILSSIRDPYNPRHCGACLSGAFMESSSPPAPEVLAKMETIQIELAPKLWDGILAFLLLKRADRQLNRLLTRLSECCCQKDDATLRRYHKNGWDLAQRLSSNRLRPEADQSGEFSPGRCSFIVDVFYSLIAVLSNSGIKSVAKGTTQSWPLHPTDIMPYGADSFVETMLQLYRFIPDTVFFGVTAQVLRISQALIVPSLLAHKFSHTVAQSLRQLVDYTMADLSRDLDESGRMHVTIRFRFRIDDLSLYFECVSKLPSDCYTELMRGCETKVMQLSSIVLYLFSDSKMPYQIIDIQDQINEFVRIGQSLFRLFHMHLYPRPDMPVHPSIENLDSNVFPVAPSCRDPPQTAFFYIHTFRTEHLCSAYKCLNSIQSAGKDFRRCSRCMVVSYCGRECQTKAWRDRDYPHKQICSILRSLMDRGGGSTLFFCPLATDMLPIIVENWKKANVHDDEFSLINKWSKAIKENRGYAMADGTEWTPGYDDYNDIIATLSSEGRGPKAKFLNRLARWPSEVAKEVNLLKTQPFWEEEIDFNR